MNIFIAGGGRVGSHLARLLSIEQHDVTVIENDRNQLENVDMAMDVRCVQGGATSILLLQEAGVGAADLFISMAGVDEVNLIAAATAKALGAKQVVARVDDRTYLDAQILYESSLGLDFLVSPEALTALEILRYIESPGIISSELIAQGRVQLRQMRLTAGSPLAGKPVREVFPSGSGVLLGVISRRGAVLIPRGDTGLEAGDELTLLGQPERMAPFKRLFQGADQPLERVVVMGAGPIGLHLAQLLEHKGRAARVFDADMERCTAAAATLKRSVVLCRDARVRAALEQEHVEDADVFVATMPDDEDNIMAAVLAKEVGARFTITVVHQPDFAPLVGKLGIDHALTPRACMANRILKLVHQASVSSTAVLGEGQVEILEFAITADTPVIGRSLRDIRTKFPKDALVATIIRGDQVIVPSGDDELHADDSVIVIATPESMLSLLRLFRK